MANLFIVLTVIFWGVGSFLGKTVLKDANSIYTYLLEVSGTLTIALLVVLFFKKDLTNVLHNFNFSGYLFGIFWGLGTVTFIFALKYKPTSTAMSLTGLYPLVTIVLAILILKEAITIKIGAGVAFATFAVLLLL